MNANIRLAALLGAVTLTAGQLAHGQDAESATSPPQLEEFLIVVDGVGVMADEVHYDGDAGVLEVTGNATLGLMGEDRDTVFCLPLERGLVIDCLPTDGWTVVRADIATIGLNGHVITAQGNVEIATPSDSIPISERWNRDSVTIHYQDSFSVPDGSDRAPRRGRRVPGFPGWRMVPLGESTGSTPAPEQ